MNLDDILNIIILFGALQGFIISILLFCTKANKQSARFLAILIFLIALASINLYGNYVNWFNAELMHFITQLLPMIMIMPLGPLLYFYVQSFTEPNFKIKKELSYHFYPIIIDLIPSFIIITYIIGIHFGLISRNPKPWVTFIDHYNVYADIPRWLSLTIYLSLASRYLSATQQKHNSISKTKLHWLRQFIRVFIGFQVIWFCYLIPYVIPSFTNQMLVIFGWYPIYIPLALLVYWLGIKGYILSYTQQQEIKRIHEIKDLLSADNLLKITLSLQRAMEIEKIYLNPTINLIGVANHVHSSPKIVSAVLNQHLQKSFNEFINEYRVAEFKKKFMSAGYEHLTITGIALECGFNSQATFQRVFKEFTGLSPSKYRKNTSQITI